MKEGVGVRDAELDYLKILDTDLGNQEYRRFKSLTTVRM